MADLYGGFDANQVDPQVAFDPIPAGDYLCAIVESEKKQTAAGDGGEYLSLKFQVLEGPHKGRVLFDNLNLRNKSQQAVDIALGTLSAICRAVGVMTPRDSQELHNLPLICKVKCAKRKDTDEFKNEIKGYAKRGSANQSNSPQASSNSTNANQSAPWKRN